MKGATTLAVALLLGFGARAQDPKLLLWGGPVYGKVKLNSFNAFVDSYNAANLGSLDKDLSPLGSSLGWQAGATYMVVKKLGMSLSFMSLTTTAESVLADGSKRVFEHRLTTPINFGLYIPLHYVEFHPRMGFCQADLHSYTEYKDGTISYGKERLLNGIYHTFGLYAGIDVGARIPLSKKLVIAVGGGYYGVSGSTYTDPNWARGLEYSTFYPSDIPTDWESWLDLSAQNNLTAYDVEDVVKLKGTWYQLYASIMIQLK